MNPQETQQVAARDEKWVPSAERVKISSTNIRLETTVPQKEETFQVIIDVIKNSTCFKAFTISADVSEIFMQQFWYTIKKVQDTDSYEFLLANKKCTINAEVFRIILDICPRLEGEDFTDVPDDETALTFLIDLGYKGPLNRHTNMFEDHMNHPWRTLAAIINKCLSRKTASNDKLRKSRIDILCGMFNRENVDYPELIWEDLAYQIDHRKEKRSRRENMPYPCFTKIIINHFLKQHKSLTNLNHKHYHIIKDDGIETVDVSEESEPKPEPAKKKTASRRVVKKKVTLSADDNIISDDLDAALELAKSISQIKAEKAEAARKVHATHVRIMTESFSESAKKKSSGRNSKSVVIQDTLYIMQALKESKKTSRRQPGTRGSHEGTGSKPGLPNESTVISTISSKGTGAKPGVPDEDKDITEEKKDNKDGDADDEGDDHVSDTQHDDDDEDDETESDEDEIYKYKIRVHNEEDVEMKDAEVEESDKGEEKVVDAAKEEAKKTSKAKDDAKKTELPPSSSSLSTIHVLVIPKTTNLPPILEIVTETPASTTVPSPQVTPIFASVQQTPTLIPTQPITTDAPNVTTTIHESNALSAVELRVAKLEKDVSELKTIDHSSEALVVLQSYVPIVVDKYLDTKVGDVFQKELQKHTADLIHKYSLQHLPELTKKPTPTSEQESEKSPSEILKIKKEQAEKQKKPEFTIKSTDKASLEEYDLKSALYQSMHTNKTFNRNHANHRLYHALMEALIKDENAMDKGVADTVKDHKRKHDDDEDDDYKDPLAGPNQGKKTKRRRTKESESSKKPSTTKETLKGKTPTKGSKTGKSALAKEPVEEPIAEVIIDDADNLDWNNLEGDRYLFDLSKPLPLLGPPGHWTVAADYFFNNDLEYLNTSDLEVTYTTSITKTKASRYDIKGIEDMVSTLWSTIKHAYNKDALIGIEHWGERRKLWYRSQVSKFSKQNVYSTKAILGVKSVSVKKLHGYGHLEEIMVKRSDQQLYKFKECDFVDLHLNDIEDMLLLVVQHKLFHLDGSDIVDFIVALRIVYEDLDKQKRVLRADELYKFSDGTLKSVRDEIHHRVLDFRRDYNPEMPKRKWTTVDRKRSSLMIELIDKQLRERDIIEIWSDLTSGSGFPAQSIGSSNTDVLDLPCLLVLITGTSQSRQHVDTSLIHIESCKSPTAVLFDDDTGRISIRHCEY
ncbi:hypothetical protein Tco_0543830 [Tanacetum coccineum]